MESDELIYELPKGLFNWYEFGKGSKALFIRGGILKREALWQGIQEEVFAEVLQEAGVIVSCMEVKDLLDQGEDFECHEKFDYIVAVGVVECCKNPEKFLCSLRRLIKEEGIFLLGTDNRLGARYFCGDRDLFTGRSFDGIENYFQVSEENLGGRSYSKAEIGGMLDKAGFTKRRFYSVMPELFMPQLVYSEDYLPEEELDTRYFASYRNPDAVFLEEEKIYSGLIQNGLFHGMANSYLIECTLEGDFSNIKHVTLSMNRGKENALVTIIRRDDTVVKKALYPEGIKRLKAIIENDLDLKRHGVPVVNAQLDGDSYIMPYIQGETALSYFRRLLLENKEKFIKKLDEFFELIIKSSDHVSYEDVNWERFDPEWKKRKSDDPDYDKWKRIAFGDTPDALGVILRCGYIDLVPLNCFYVNNNFLFYDQEFFIENLPANVLLWRTINLIYQKNSWMEAILPQHELQERYHLNEYLGLWEKFSEKFLYDLRNDRILSSFYQIHRRNPNIIHSNRQRVNYSENEYERVFKNIFHNIEGKKIYLFGSGTYTKNFLSRFGNDYEVTGILDNDPAKWNKNLGGISISSPDILKGMPIDEYKVLICIKNYIPVLLQLKQLGVKNYGIFDGNLEYPRKKKPMAVIDSKEKPVPKKYHTGYIAGVFDLFHIGHLNMFKRAKEQCEYLIVGVVTDESVIRDKKTSPYISFDERIEIVRSCRYVDEAVEIPTDFGNSEEAYRRYRFDAQFSGSDYENDPEWLGKKVYLQKQGSDLVFFPYTQSTSSSKLKEMISQKLL